MVRDLIVNARLDLGDWNTAIEERREAVRWEPTLSFAHKDLGRILFDAGYIDEAVDAFREAIRLDPRFTPTQVDLARALWPWASLKRPGTRSPEIEAPRAPHPGPSSSARPDG